MDKAQFQNYIRNPGEITINPDLGLLDQVIKTYPFFQSAYILSILANHESKSTFYSPFLQNSAVFVADREVLFHLVNHPNQLSAKTPKKHDEKKDELRELDRMVETNAKSFSSDQLLNEIQQKHSESKKVTHETNQAFEEKKSQQKTHTDKSAEHQSNPERNEESFEEWLKKLKKPNKVNRKEEKPIKNHVQGRSGSETNKGKKEQSDQAIIDNFLQQAPRLSRPKTKFYNPVEKARESIEEDENLVSEPLAKIHWEQGHLKKAKQIYERLTLLYPDKFDYFARKIEEINSQETKGK